MSERRVLFIVEGKRGEPRLLKRMHNVLFGTHPGNICYHGTVIHDLISRLFVDGFLYDRCGKKNPRENKFMDHGPCMFYVKAMIQ